MHYTDVKGILSPKNGMNLYRGCTHGCIYCDSRSVCYQFEHEFTDIEIKRNAPELLEKALRSKRKRCMIGTGSMCDPYMPVEETERLTRRCLELIDRYEFGIAIQTKSDRILRDIDLLESINRKSKAVAQMTLTTFDEDLCRILEPGVCTTRQRYLALKEFQKRGIPTVVWLCPVLPFINDTEENLRGILGYCFDAGVKGIICMGMGVTLRAGSRDYFYSCLDRSFPGLRRRYEQTFGDSYICNSPRNSELMRIFTSECRARGVMFDPNEIFAYLSEFPEPEDGQLSFF
ncbi:MAG: radical SAM protein [Ruminococcus sp.]|nr:radical SAM protein [Ruminococcus sp.]